MLFLVIARDAAGADVPALRARVRDEHLQNLEPYVACGQIVLGGAILDEAGVPNGSALVAEFGTQGDLEAFLQRDSYTRSGVWESFEIYPFRRAV